MTSSRAHVKPLKCRHVFGAINPISVTDALYRATKLWKMWPIFCTSNLNCTWAETFPTFAPTWWYYISTGVRAEGQDRLPAASGGHLQDCNSPGWIREAFVTVLSHQKSGPECTVTLSQFQSLQDSSRCRRSNSTIQLLNQRKQSTTIK